MSYMEFVSLCHSSVVYRAVSWSYCNTYYAQWGASYSLLARVFCPSEKLSRLSDSAGTCLLQRISIPQRDNSIAHVYKQAISNYSCLLVLSRHSPAVVVLRLLFSVQSIATCVDLKRGGHLTIVLVLTQTFWSQEVCSQSWKRGTHSIVWFWQPFCVPVLGAGWFAYVWSLLESSMIFLMRHGWNKLKTAMQHFAFIVPWHLIRYLPRNSVHVGRLQLQDI